MYHIFITAASNLNFYLQFWRDNLLTIEIIFTKFMKNLSIFTPRNEWSLLFLKFCISISIYI